MDAFLHVLGGEAEQMELIDGRVLLIEPPSRTHDLLATRMREVLRRQLSGRPWRVLHDVMVCVADRHALRPDVVVVFEGWDPSDGVVVNPAIIVEVMSASSAVRDRGCKRAAYFEIADLQHYVLISTRAHSLELFSRQGEREWLYRSYCDDLSRMIELPGFDLCIHMAAVYQGVELDERRWRED